MDTKEADLLIKDFSRYAEDHHAPDTGAQSHAGAIVWSALGLTMAAALFLSAIYA